MPSSFSPAGASIRPLDPTDVTGPELEQPAPDSDGPHWRRSLVAVLDDHVIGVATLALAPAVSCFFAEVAVDPAYRRRGIGTQLFDALRDQAANPALPIQGRAMSTQPQRGAFAEHLGGEIVVRCPMPIVDLRDAAVVTWLDDQRVPDGYRIQPATEVPEDAVRDAWCDCFRWTNEAVGGVDSGALLQQWERYRSGVDPALSAIALDRTDSVVAVALLSPDAWDGRNFLVAETRHRDQPDGNAVLRATVATALRAAGGRGLAQVEIEGHLTDAHIPDLVDGLPHVTSDPLDIYRFPPRAADADAAATERLVMA